MVINGREIILKAKFLDELYLIQEFIKVYDSKKGKVFPSKILDFVYDNIAPNPYLFSEFPFKRTPNQIYRKAIFQKKYILV